MKKLLLAIFLLIPVQLWAQDSKVSELTATTSPANTDVLYIVVDPSGTPTSRKVTAGNLGQAILIATTTVASLPSPTTGMIRAVTDGTSATDCTTGGGSTVVICWYDGTEWTSIGSTGGTDTLDTVIGRGNTANGCTEADPCEFGNGTVAIQIYANDANQTFIKPSVASNRYTNIDTDKLWCLYDEETAACVLTVDPDAASTLPMYTFGTAYKPRKSVVFTADSFYTQGTCTLTTNAALISGGLTEPYITCTDADTAGFHRSYQMIDSWDGGTLTFSLSLVNVNATPANDYEIDFSATCVPLGTAIATTISTTGEQPVNIDFDAGGTCGGSACAQNAFVKKVSAAVTPNGTCAGGNLLRIQGQVDATATTTAQVADVKIIDVKMEYSVTSLSD